VPPPIRPAKIPATTPDPAVKREEPKLQAQVPQPAQPVSPKLQPEPQKPQPDPPKQAIPTPPVPETAPPQSFIPKFGTITWAGELASNEDLTITGNIASTGKISGERFPPRTAVEVNLIESPGVNILALPGAANQYTLRLRNTSDRPTKYIRIHWTTQK